MSFAGLSLLALSGCGGGGGGDGGGIRLTTPSRYAVQVLGVAGTEGWIFPRAINERGQVAGYMQLSADELRAFHYDGNQVRNITAPQGMEVSPRAVNESGRVAGVYWDAGNTPRAFTWQDGVLTRVFTDLTTAESQALAVNVGGTVGGIALLPGTGRAGLVALPNQPTRNLFQEAGILDLNDLNDRNQVVGRTVNGSAIWSPTEPVVRLEPEGQQLDATSINERGEIAGVRRNASGGVTPFFRSASGTIEDLTTASFPGWSLVEINEEGQIAGYAIEPAGGGVRDRPFIWGPGGAGFRFIEVPEGRSARVIALNDRGQVVGYSSSGAQADRAFTWSAQQGFVDLNRDLIDAPEGLVVLRATAIANDGTIAAISNRGPVLLRPRA
ncbi:hypothetical protein [Caldimonas tepidiphila]|uniref:hypothetical protein n=1 Tax=Caldimonas tepidiphila TaxID=2315841 RepID=UPI001300838C|nr:hypothetical protein [Caldimonas tepidiphila]